MIMICCASLSSKMLATNGSQRYVDSYVRFAISTRATTGGDESPYVVGSFLQCIVLPQQLVRGSHSAECLLHDFCKGSWCTLPVIHQRSTVSRL